MMKAAVLRCAGVGPEMEDVDLDAPHPGEVRVRVEAAGVCHTELHYISGEIPCPLPIVLGHEGVGVVEEVSGGVNDIVSGQRVVFTWRPRCGECEYCVTGRPVMCVYGRVQASSGGLMDGTSRLHRGNEEIHHFLGVSCFAERAVVSRSRRCPDCCRHPRTCRCRCRVCRGHGSGGGLERGRPAGVDSGAPVARDRSRRSRAFCRHGRPLVGSLATCRRRRK